MHNYQIRLFGEVSVRCGAVTPAHLPAKTQELFCYLLLHRDHPHTREFLAGQLWSDASASQSKKYLRQNLWQLQAALHQQPPTQATPVLLVSQRCISINPEASMWLDTWQLADTFAQVRHLQGEDFLPQHAQAAQQAIGLYQGDLLDGWYQDWCLIERERFQSMFLVLLDKLIDYCLAQHQCEQGVEYGLRALRYDPTREKTHRRLMRLHYLAGDRAAALRQFEQCSTLLAEEFHVKPTRRTIELIEQICADQGDTGQPPPNDTARLPHEEVRLLPRVLSELDRIQSHLAALQQDVEAMKRLLNQQT
jgi:DNA-binding SARP family transcriptional activator